jgi:hypothetical protein
MRKRDICRVRQTAHSPYAHGRAVHEGPRAWPLMAVRRIAISEAESEARGRSGLGRHMALDRRW